jgi:hypothetical protein
MAKAKATKPGAVSKTMTIKHCLASLDIPLGELEKCCNLQTEWACIKKSYFKKTLVHHPDKGGDAAVFRDVHIAFEVLRQLFANDKLVSFLATRGSSRQSADQSTAEYHKQTVQDINDNAMPTPSMEYYERAATTCDAPVYQIERTKPPHSRCIQKVGVIVRHC